MSPALAFAEAPALPYGYERLDEPASEASVELAAEADAVSGTFALVNPVNGVRAVKIEAVLFDDGGLVVTGWQGIAGEPILRPEIDPAEELDLVRALRAHLPEGARVLALPERSRRLARLTRLDLPMAQAPLDDTLRMPALWAQSAEAIAQSETVADGQPVTPDGWQSWQRLRDALVAPADEGPAGLAALAKGGSVYLVLHVSDPFHLGIGMEDHLAMVMRDLAQADVHSAARQVKLWQREGGYAAYAVQTLGMQGLRTYFLTSPADRDLLVTRLLPFIPAQVDPPSGFRLVWQGGGYWVWEVASG